MRLYIEEHIKLKNKRPEISIDSHTISASPNRKNLAMNLGMYHLKYT